ncbi:MAG: uvrC1, partial [Clostridiales bacterium]|nr:uvrC1 [Clostridiales bacterium]
DTEFEAFMLECRLIKNLKPRYNRLMKNPLSYNYIKVALAEKNPSIEAVSTEDNVEGALYFGPYTSKNTAIKAVEAIKGFYKINCTNHYKNNNPCLNYSLGLCIGLCLGDSAVTAQYEAIIKKVINLLNGTDNTLLKEIEEKMLSASANFDFEAAARYRDYIGSISYLISNAKTLEFTAENRNIVMLEALGEASVKLFLIRKNNVLFSKVFSLSTITTEQFSEAVQTKIMEYFNGDTFTASDEVAINEIDEAQIIYSYLKNSSCCYTVIPENLLFPESNLQLQEIIIKWLAEVAAATDVLIKKTNSSPLMET